MEAEAYKLAVKSLKGRLIAPYQREGVLWMLMRELKQTSVRGGFLCDEMGLGKTVQIISTILGNPDKKTLIIVPKSIVNQWYEELEKFAPQLSVHMFDGADREMTLEIFEESDVVIAPYSVMIKKGKPKGHPTEMRRFQWGRVVLDEGHEIRSASSKIHASMKTLRSNIRWVISGTPVYNSMKDFIALCGFLGIPKTLCQGMTEKIRTTYVLRRTKQDVASLIRDWPFLLVTFRMWNLKCTQRNSNSTRRSTRNLRVSSRNFLEKPMWERTHAHPRVSPTNQTDYDLAAIVH